MLYTSVPKLQQCLKEVLGYTAHYNHQLLVVITLASYKDTSRTAVMYDNRL